MRVGRTVASNKVRSEHVFDATDAATKAFMAPHTSYIAIFDRNKKVIYTGVGPDQNVDAALKADLLRPHPIVENEERAGPGSSTLASAMTTTRRLTSSLRPPAARGNA